MELSNNASILGIVIILLVGSCLSIYLSAMDDQTINLFPLVVVGCSVWLGIILWKLKKVKQ